MNRSNFLRSTGAALVAGWAGGLSGCAASLSRSAGGAGPLPTLQSIGLQLSTVRELLTRDLPGTLHQVARIGYRNVETSADLPEKLPSAELRSHLDAAGLRSPVGLYRTSFLDADLPGVINAATTLGQSFVGLPSLGDISHSTREEYRAVAERLNEWGARLRHAGLHLTYHNHAAEFDTLGGDSPAFDILLERTDPDLVGFELDLYWINKAGYDPVSYFERFPGRFPLLHLKDSTAAPEKDFAPVGEGVIDFRRILSYANTAGMEFAFVEHDRPADPAESMRTSYATLSRMLPHS